MDLQAKVKQIDKPLSEWGKNVGYSWLENWLAMGGGYELDKCLSELVNGWSVKEIFLKNLNFCIGPTLELLATLNTLIPPMPNFIEIALDDSNTCPKHCNDIVDKLVSKIIKPLFALVCENPHKIEVMSEIPLIF